MRLPLLSPKDGSGKVVDPYDAAIPFQFSLLDDENRPFEDLIIETIQRPVSCLLVSRTVSFVMLYT